MHIKEFDLFYNCHVVKKSSWMATRWVLANFYHHVMNEASLWYIWSWIKRYVMLVSIVPWFRGTIFVRAYSLTIMYVVNILYSCHHPRSWRSCPATSASVGMIMTELALNVVDLLRNVLNWLNGGTLSFLSAYTYTNWYKQMCILCDNKLYLSTSCHWAMRVTLK